MKTDISHIPLKRQRELEHVVATVLKEFEEDIRGGAPQKKRARIEKIILYGSYARDDWKEDHRSGFSSDFDILVVVSAPRLAKFNARWIMHSNDEFLRLETIEMARQRPQPITNMIVHSTGELNESLRRGRYFFVDIIKEGVLLYEALGAKKFPKPGTLAPDVALEEAQMHFGEWQEGSDSFFRSFGHSVDDGDLKIATFHLHQTVEQLYQCILLVLTNYAPASHNIKHLRSLCEDRDNRLIDVWPRATKREESHFNKLKEAYVKARYSKKWKIDRERLDWLTEKVQHLQKLTKTICEERLEELEKQTKK